MQRFGWFSRVTHHRLTCLILVLFLLCSSLLGCSASRPIKPSKQDLKVVATCAGHDIYYDELRYIVMTYKNAYAATYGEDVWANPEKAEQYLPDLLTDISESLKTNYAVLTLGTDFGIDINDEDIQQQVQSTIDEQIDVLGNRSAYKQLLEELYMTDHFVRFTVGADACESQLCYALITAGFIINNELDFTLYALEDEHMCATYHIFIGNDEGDDIDNNRAMAEQVREMLVTGTDIKSLVGSVYNEDIYAPTTPYYFMKTEYEQAYEDAAFALEIGEISDIVESEDGFYIIVRQPLDPDYITANLTELMQRYQYAELQSLLAEQRALLTVEWTDYGKSLDLVAMQ